MEPAKAHAAETEVWQAAREPHFRIVSYQVCQYIPRAGFSVEGVRSHSFRCNFVFLEEIKAVTLL